MEKELKQIPIFQSDEEAENFVATADLTEYDLSAFKHTMTFKRTPVSFEYKPKTSVVNLRLPQELLNIGKARAKAQGMPFTRYIRALLEQDANRHP